MTGRNNDLSRGLALLGVGVGIVGLIAMGVASVIKLGEYCHDNDDEEDSGMPGLTYTQVCALNEKLAELTSEHESDDPVESKEASRKLWSKAYDFIYGRNALDNTDLERTLTESYLDEVPREKSADTWAWDHAYEILATAKVREESEPESTDEDETEVTTE